MTSIRDARAEDAVEVAGVHIRAWQEAYRGLLPDEYLDGLRVEERAARYSLGSSDPDSPHTILAVEDDGTIAAFASLGSSRDEDAPDAGEVYALYVDPPRWGTGVGRLLMAEAKTRLRARGFHEAILWVLFGNAAAARFYRADGWRRDGGHRHEDVWGVDAEVVRYRRTLV
jgi:GNAT superfamily N-acetyltransferase